MSTSANGGTNWKRYVISPLFVGVGAYMNGVWVDQQMPDSPILFLDVVLNMLAYDTSILFSEYVLDKMTVGSVMEDGLNRVVEPVLQGIVNAAVPHFSIDHAMIQTFANQSYGAGAASSYIRNKSFLDRFIDGCVLNIAATYLSEPLTG